jgi:peptidoglycan/LPS O-acetylase OafA/YrhL
MTPARPAVQAGASVDEQPPAKRAAPRHIAELDGIRGIAILGVMLLHFVGSISAQNLPERVLAKLSVYGVWGVDLFFVLSGFLITGILHDAKGAPHYFRNFYARRTLRIFPLYYAVLLVLALVPAAALTSSFGQLAEAKRVQGYLWPYLTNFYVASTGGFSVPYVSHFWSLAVEEHFYLFWPFVVGALSRAAGMRVCIALSLLALGLRIGFSHQDLESMKALVWTPCRLDALCCGAWFALAVRAPERRASLERACGRLAPALALLIFLLSAWHTRLGVGDAWVLPLRGSALALLFGTCLVLVTAEGGPALVKRGLRAGWLRVLGKYSYGLYVFHGIVAYAAHEHHWEARWTTALGSHGAAVALVALVGMGLSFVIAITSFELFEQPVLKLKRFFEYRGLRPALASAEDGKIHGAKAQ